MSSPTEQSNKINKMIQLASELDPTSQDEIYYRFKLARIQSKRVKNLNENKSNVISLETNK